MIRWDEKRGRSEGDRCRQVAVKKGSTVVKQKKEQIVCSIKWMHVHRHGSKILLSSRDLLISNTYHFQFSKISQKSHFFTS